MYVLLLQLQNIVFFRIPPTCFLLKYLYSLCHSTYQSISNGGTSHCRYASTLCLETLKKNLWVYIPYPVS